MVLVPVTEEAWSVENTLQHSAHTASDSMVAHSCRLRNLHLPRLHSPPLHATTQDCHRGHWAHTILRPQCQAAQGKLAQVIRATHPQQTGPLPLLSAGKRFAGTGKAALHSVQHPSTDFSSELGSDTPSFRLHKTL